MSQTAPTGLKRELALYLSAQQFLTRLPSPDWIGWEADRLARAARYYPVVGLLLGVIAGAVWLLASQILSPLIAAGLALGTLMLLTGALHEDGLADCCDGLGGGRTRERALEIMRDSRIGAYGAAGLIVSLGLRWAALASFGPWEGAAALIVALVAGRAGMTAMLARGTYARADGAASTAGGVRFDEMNIAGAIALGTGLICCGFAGLFAAAAAILIAALWLKRVETRLGGYTGDTLGAAEQFGQIAVLLILSGTIA